MIHNNFKNIVINDAHSNRTKFVNPLSRIKFIIFGGNINKI